MTPKTLPLRSEIPVEYTWNDTTVFESRQAWAAEVRALETSFAAFDRFRGHLADSPAVLADWLDAWQETFRRVLTVYFYAYMTMACDTTDSQAAAMSSQSRALRGRMLAACAFAQPEILAVGRDTLERWMAQEPRLPVYAHYFDDLFRRQAHVRSGEVEEVLGLLEGPLGSVEVVAQALVNGEMALRPATDSAGESVVVAQSNIDQLLLSPDREVRRTAWESYADGHLAFKNTLTANYGVAVQGAVIAARARRYGSSLEAALSKDNIPLQVHDNLIDTCRKHLPTWQRYWAVRRQALGVDALYPYDVWAPITRCTPTIPYQQAVDWISAGLAPLGDDYVSALRRGCLEDRWVDVYPYQGKMQGAFSFGAPGTYPFIHMSYADDLSSFSTLAHELGHSMHSYLTDRSQPVVYAEYSMFVAEVASNFHQAMVRAYLLDHNPDPEFQIAVIEEAMDNFHRYLFLMPTLARFEREVHRRVEAGEALDADALIELTADLFAEGYGSEMAYDRTRVGITWAQFPHFYVPFYVFQYATGISAANALARRVRSGMPGAAEDYVRFLSAGASLYPVEAVRLAGVDMATPEPVEAAFEVLEDYIDRLEALVKARR